MSISAALTQHDLGCPVSASSFRSMLQKAQRLLGSSELVTPIPLPQRLASSEAKRVERIGSDTGAVLGPRMPSA
jgi:hypothetical protein